MTPTAIASRTALREFERGSKTSRRVGAIRALCRMGALTASYGGGSRVDEGEFSGFSFDSLRSVFRVIPSHLLRVGRFYRPMSSRSPGLSANALFSGVRSGWRIGLGCSSTLYSSP